MENQQQATVSEPQIQNQSQQYVATAPVEKSKKNPGMIEGIIGIVCAVISLLLLPIIFGPAGIILGVFSLKKGAKTLGLVTIILSAVFMIVGMVFGAIMGMMRVAQGGFSGILF